MAKLITFADGSFGIRSAAKRLVRQGLESGYFSGGCESWDLSRLISVDLEFKDKHLSFVRENPKGFGLWVWKPAVLLNAMSLAPEGELIVFLDAGCQVVQNSLAANRFKEYLNLAENSGFLFIQIKNGAFGVENSSEKHWSKKSCIQHFNLGAELTEATQVQSGVIIIANTVVGRNFVSKWYENCIANNYELLRDPGVEEIQEPGFVSHRWEQSILSLMVKQQSLLCLADETYWYPNWRLGLDYPIWTMRNRSGGDAFRRNGIDLFLIVLAKLERQIRSFI
jgi:hypothetical protein